MRYFITISYNGAGFFGWQVQPGAPSVQQTLEQALGTLLRRETPVTGAGRTDTGVNAIGYVAHFEHPDELDAKALGYKLNAILPPSIVVHSICPAGPEDHARFSATNREYTYFLNRVKDPFVENFSYRCLFDINVKAMNEAARFLIGTHDFSCFEKTGTDCKTSICTVREAFWAPYTPTHASIMGFGEVAGKSLVSEPYLFFRISADRFLRNMVRAVVGTLLDVGRGKKSLEEFSALVLPPQEGRKGSRCAAGESVPGHALFLSKVSY